MQPEIAEIDFETDQIDPIDYPPKPVGVAVAFPNGESVYWAFGHPTGNNCTEDEARTRLRQVEHDYRLSMHNAFFDLSVGRKWQAWDWPRHGFEDTLPMVFIDQPRAVSLGLKETAERELGLPPTERDAVHEWLTAKGYRAKTRKALGAYIAKAPGDLVGKYAMQDVKLTRALREHFMPKILSRVAAQQESMPGEPTLLDAYHRELQLTPVLIRMTERGIGIDCARLEDDTKAWAVQLQDIDTYLRTQLRIGESVNIDSDAELATAIEGYFAFKGWEAKWMLTDSGKRSVAADALKVMLKPVDPELYTALERRGIISTCLNTFGLNWLKMAARDGRAHIQWNATPNNYGTGAHSGRISSRPNFQNVIRNTVGKKGYRDDLPTLREYIVPAAGRSLYGRDYSQQELRTLAHFEEGLLYDRYHENPNLDVHELVKTMLNEKHGLNVERNDIKITVFGLIYGMGVGLLAKQLSCSVERSKQIKAAILNEVPGIARLQIQLRKFAKDGLPLRTLGGREYFCKPSKPVYEKLSKKELETQPPKVLHYIDYAYQMLNYLIQPSAADMTKQAMIDADAAGIEMVLTVHDEILAEADETEMPSAMARLRTAMENIKLDVPLLSEGKASNKAWGLMTKYEDPNSDAIAA